MSEQGTGRWVTLQEAATELGTSLEAVRMRVRRKTLDSRKGEDGRLLVYRRRTRARAGRAESTGLLVRPLPPVALRQPRRSYLRVIG